MAWANHHLDALFFREVVSEKVTVKKVKACYDQHCKGIACYIAYMPHRKIRVDLSTLTHSRVDHGAQTVHHAHVGKVWEVTLFCREVIPENVSMRT